MPKSNISKSTLPHSTPRDVFYYLLMIVTLYIGVIAFITVLIQYVNFIYPDPFFFGSSGASSGILAATSAVIVAWPVYILMAWLIGRDIKHDPARREIRIRKWLLYLTLFIAAITIIIDLVTVTFNFLSGELTIKFALKVLAVLIVTGAVFGFYLWELRRKVGTKSNLPKIFTWVASTVLVAVVVTGFFVVGTPQEQRARRLDDQRVSELQQTQSEIFNYYSSKKTLAPSIDALKNDVTGFVPLKDPETKQPYEYRVTGNLKFQLCATFKTENKGTTIDMTRSAVPAGLFGETWAHGIGRVCFDRTIDPSLFNTDQPTINKVPPVIL